MAGEFTVSQPAVFRREKWWHTMSATKLSSIKPNTLRRNNNNEELKGFIYYNRAEDISFELHNLKTIIDNSIPCWPDPKILLDISSRHLTLARCVDAGLVSHPVLQGKHEDNLRLPFPFVLKTGESHCGEDKFLITKEDDIHKWEGVATIEPFFDGVSFRVLIIGDRVFGIKVFNNDSWIKNSAGADIEMFDPPQNIIDHAQSVRKLFNLEIAGVDYILMKDGSFEFLEFNQYPGLSASEEVIIFAQDFLNKKMQYVEDLCI